MTKNNRHMKRIRSLIAICTIIAVIVSVSTYAWFVGMKTVNVASFDVEIKTTQGLQLSLTGNGSDWADTVTLDKTTMTTGDGYYAGNTNKWPELIPVSSIGEIDYTRSRMKLYEKASFTKTAGGYRIMNSEVDLKGTDEGDGYMVFDLFVKNTSGEHYIEEFDKENEESIYLSIDSSATSENFGSDQDTGIQNSVRVAFAQIGRVIGSTTSQAAITGITCSDATVDGVEVTGIKRTAQIWEPNDIRHVEAAIKYYDTSCRKRIAATVADSSYSTDTCKAIVDGAAYNTYAVRGEITAAQGVDVYDGEYNSWTGNTTGDTSPLYAYDTFTDTNKLEVGTSRPEFMSLAPHSITKVRVYIWIEGQDIDNHNFASIGKKITVNFGFTKERFTPGDINYTGPDISTDTTAPIIHLLGATPYIMNVGGTYTEPGAKAIDNYDGDITSALNITGTVDAETPGSYTITYTAEDAKNNVATATRTVIVR